MTCIYLLRSSVIPGLCITYIDANLCLMVGNILEDLYNINWQVSVLGNNSIIFVLTGRLMSWLILGFSGKGDEMSNYSNRVDWLGTRGIVIM